MANSGPCGEDCRRLVNKMNSMGFNIEFGMPTDKEIVYNFDLNLKFEPDPDENLYILVSEKDMFRLNLML